MYAIIRTGGKQYRVQPGDVVRVERIAGEVGSKVSLDEVLFVAGDGAPLRLPAPTPRRRSPCDATALAGWPAPALSGQMSV